MLTQPHLTICLVDILMVLQNFDRKIKHILGVNTQVVDVLSHHPHFQWEHCNSMPLEVCAAREWIEDVNAGLIDVKWFGPIACSFANPCPYPLPSNASPKGHKL